MSAVAGGPDAFDLAASSPFLGRAEELALLDQVLERATEYQAPQVVTVVGNQGVGKSRLIGEWLKRVVARPAPRVRVYRGRATEGAGAFSLISRLLADRFAIGDGEAASSVAEKVRAELNTLFADRRVAEVIHFLGRYLQFDGSRRGAEEGRDAGLRMTPFLRALEEHPAQHDQIARAVLRHFLEVDAARTPLVLAFDDLHFGDDDSLGLLSALGDELGGSPVVLVAVTRPDLFVRRTRWGAGSADHTRIDLQPLPRPDAEALLRRLLQRAETLPEVLVDELCEMTAGNPLFLEELVRVFYAEGILAPSPDDEGDEDPRWRIDVARARRVQLPVTVAEAVQLRIASLSGDERDLLEKGASFGNVFWTGALMCLRRLDRTVAESAAEPRRFDDRARAGLKALLDGLVEREYLLEMPDSSIPGEHEYVFKHNLERDLVARMTLPEAARRHHLYGAQWLETRLKDRGEEQLEFLAGLYAKGGLSARAAAAYVAAGDRARSRYANEAAAALYGKGLELIDRDDALGRLDALHNLGDVTALSGRTREALGLFEEMLRAAWLLDAGSKAGAAHGRIGRCYRTLGEFDRAEYHLGLGLDLFTRARDHRGVAGAEDDLGRVSFLRGDFQRALDRHGRALDLRRELGDPRSIALALHNLAVVHHASGNHSQAMARFDEALQIRRAIDDRLGVAHSLLEMGSVWRDRGAHDRALAVYKEAISLTREIGDRITEAAVGTRIGETLLRAGRLTEAVDALRLAVEVAGGMGDRLMQAEASRLLGEALLEMGESLGARRQCEQALALAERIGSRPHRGTAHRALAVAMARVPDGDRGSAEAHFRSAVELLGEVGADSELMRAYRDYAEFLAEGGDADGALTLRERADEILGRLREGAQVSVDVEVD
ncbi:MAG: tetratricopeptide repeat protein [Myxococcales bacterium]|nr:tetratricopeptide repeat protein [Myxococcales bacterium]